MSSILLGMLQLDETVLADLDPSLARISEVLDAHQDELYQFVKNQSDFTWGGNHTLSLCATIRLSIYKTIKSMTYRDLSSSTRSDLALRMFCGIGDMYWINKSTLQEAISTLPQSIIEKVNQMLCIRYEDLSTVRIDSTSVAANVAQPENNNLLYESLRRGNKIMSRIEKKVGNAFFSYSIDAVSAKRISYDIRFECNDAEAKQDKYTALLLKAAQMQDDAPMIIEQALAVIETVQETRKADAIKKLVNEFIFLVEKLSCVIYQTISWLQGDKLSPDDKLFSVATDMEHVDIIIKDNRKIVYGHKVDVAQGPKGLITHMVIHSGNPSDSSTLINTVTLLETIFGEKINTIVADGGYNSKSNLAVLKEKKIKENVFTRKRSLAIEDMGVSCERFSELKNWRSGIERCIGRLKKKFGFGKVVSTTFERFKLYLWIGVLAANVSTIAAKQKIFQ